MWRVLHGGISSVIKGLAFEGRGRVGAIVLRTAIKEFLGRFV